VQVWLDDHGRLTSELGPVDDACHVEVVVEHCPGRDFCAVFDRPPGARILYGSVQLADIGHRPGLLTLNQHGVRIGNDLVAIAATHVLPEGRPGHWVYRLLPVRWRTAGGFVDDTAAMLGVWAD
jgi:hypothetical protein